MVERSHKCINVRPETFEEFVAFQRGGETQDAALRRALETAREHEGRKSTRSGKRAHA